MDDVIDALRRALEAHGVPGEYAQSLAAAHRPDVAAEPRPVQHVVPVATGWLVISRVALTDAEVFAEQEEAVARARELAAAGSGAVVLHDAAGRETTLPPR